MASGVRMKTFDESRRLLGSSREAWLFSLGRRRGMSYSGKSSPSGGTSAITAALSVVALIVSGVTAYYSSSLSRDVVTSQMIHESYDTFYELHRLQLENPALSHLFVMPDSYAIVADQVATATSSLGPAELAGLRLKERAAATLIFVVYEDSFYQWKQAVAAGDRNRASFLWEVLAYLDGRLLRNPRLLFYWSPQGGKLVTYFEAETRKHYYQYVAERGMERLAKGQDIAGPIGRSQRSQPSMLPESQENLTP